MVRSLDLPFDDETDAVVRILWGRLEETGVSTLASYTHRRHRPHVSLLVAEEIGLDAAAEILAGIGIERGVVRLELTGPAFFPGDESILYLAVTPTSELLRLHAAVFEAIGPVVQGAWEHYRPGSWVPHSTLSMAVPMRAVGDAVTTCLSTSLPIVASATSIDCFDARTGKATRLIELA